LAGCRREAPVQTKIDLLQLFAYTDSGQQTSQIDFGAATAPAYLIRGWSPSETLSSGEVVARAVAREALLRFAVRDPGDTRLYLRCGLLSDDHRAARPQRITMQVNGRFGQQLTVRDRLEDLVVDLPRRLLQPGENI